MRLHAPLFISLFLAIHCFAENSILQKPIEISVYNLTSGPSLQLTSITGDSTILPTYSGALTKWQKVVAPIKIGKEEDSSASATWTPAEGADAGKWILIYYMDQSSKEAKVRAFPAKTLMRDKSTLFLINLTALNLKGKSGDGELGLGPNSHTYLEISRPNLSIQLKSSATPHYAQVSLIELDSGQSYLLLFAEPYIKGSAMLNHQLVTFPNIN